MSTNPDLTIKYKFIFNPENIVEYEIRLDSISYELIQPEKSEIPFWCNLDYMQCDVCTNNAQKMDYCSLAVNSIDIVNLFADSLSFEIVDIIVETNERNYFKEKVPIQRALGSLFGIIMVTSGCKDLDKLRPMVRFHLPFASIEETIYRTISMYQMAQYLRVQRGLKPDYDMNELVGIYKRIHNINIHFVKRLQKATEQDANLNAVVILDSFSQIVPLELQGSFDRFEDIFSPYLE